MYYTKKSLQLLNIVAIALIGILTVIFIKYKPVYKVKLQNEELGIVENKNIIENDIQEYIYDNSLEVAFINDDKMPQYELTFIERATDIEKTSIIEHIKQQSIVTYKVYAIVFEGDIKEYVNTIEQAQEVISEIEKEFGDSINLDLGIREIYTDNIQSLETVEYTTAKTNIDDEISKQYEIESILEGIAFKRPVSGTITSRFGPRSRGNHTGLDIAAPTGTKMTPAASGTVTYAGYRGSYGNLVIISHGNGIETYYAHCNKIYVKAGDEVKLDDTIATVGSTGNSTGPHLHLEIRINNKIVNPQNYLYK